jgi:hypothetical protein
LSVFFVFLTDRSIIAGALAKPLTLIIDDQAVPYKIGKSFEVWDGRSIFDRLLRKCRVEAHPFDEKPALRP